MDDARMMMRVNKPQKLKPQRHIGLFKKYPPFTSLLNCPDYDLSSVISQAGKTFVSVPSSSFNQPYLVQPQVMKTPPPPAPLLSSSSELVDFESFTALLNKDIDDLPPLVDNGYVASSCKELRRIPASVSVPVPSTPTSCTTKQPSCLDGFYDDDDEYEIDIRGLLLDLQREGRNSLWDCLGEDEDWSASIAALEAHARAPPTYVPSQMFVRAPSRMVIGIPCTYPIVPNTSNYTSMIPNYTARIPGPHCNTQMTPKGTSKSSNEVVTIYDSDEEDGNLLIDNSHMNSCLADFVRIDNYVPRSGCKGF